MTRSGEVTHRWQALHSAAAVLAAAFGLLPRRWRFRAAAILARLAVPLFRTTEAYRLQRQARIDGAEEIALFFVTNALTVNGTVFDPIVAIDGFADFVRLCREGRGVLLVQPHAALTHLPFRIFYDQGLEPIGVNADGEMRIAGTKVRANPLVPSPMLLLTARNRLREGRLVCAAIDRRDHSGERTVEVETANGPVIVAPALLQVAVRCGARVAFTEAHVEGWGVAARIVIASSETAEGLTREFSDFVREHIAARFGGEQTAVAPPARGLTEANR